MKDRRDIFRELQAIDRLPTLPAVIERLGCVIRDPNSDARRVSRIIEDDPAITARVLKTVNSVFYAGSRPISSVREAVARMGMNAVHNVAISTSVFGAFGEGPGGPSEREEFWRHSIITGIGAMVIYDRAQDHLAGLYGRDVLHLAGLLHDMGKIVLDGFFHDEFVSALGISRAESIPLQTAEERVIGANHAEVGSWLGIRWNLSPDLIQVIRWHHETRSADAEHRDLVEMVHTANYICNLEGLARSGDGAPAYDHEVWKRLGLTVADIPEVVEQIREKAEKSELLLALA
ncbi:MAG: HDOD domain-containing protein [Candidatus Eisenbacteria bacterium]